MMKKILAKLSPMSEKLKDGKRGFTIRRSGGSERFFKVIRDTSKQKHGDIMLDRVPFVDDAFVRFITGRYTIMKVFSWNFRADWTMKYCPLLSFGML